MLHTCPFIFYNSDSQGQIKLSLNLSEYQEQEDENGEDYLKLMGSSTLQQNFNTRELGLFVEGYEINFGWWSRDSYRCYSAADYLRDIHKNHPNYVPTQADIMRVTEAELLAWFNNKHKVERSWILGGDDWPRDVKCFRRTEIKMCTILNLNSLYNFNGKITFPDGVTCDIEPVELYDPAISAFNNESQTIALKVKSPCASCHCSK